MEIQRTNLSQSAAGALLAALAKSDSPDGASFQRHFAETIDAVTPRRQGSGRQEQPIEDEARSSKPRVERRSAGRVAKADPAEAAPPEEAQVAAAVETRSASSTAEVEPTAAGQEPATVSTEAVEPAPKASERQETAARPAPVAVQQGKEPSQEPSMSDAARALLKALGDVARVVVADGAADVELQQSEAAALVALGVKLQAPASAASALSNTTGDEGQEVASDTATEFAVKQAQVGQSVKTEPDESAALAARRVTVHRDSQAAQAGQGVRTSASTGSRQAAGDTDVESQAAPAAKASLLTQARPAAQTAQAVPQVQAEVVAINVTSSTTGSVLDGQDDSTQGRIAAPPTTAKTAASAATQSSERTSSANQGEQIDRIARVMRASIGRGGSRVNLELEPRDLGPLRIQMNLRGQELTARFETQTETARQYLEQGLNQLRDGLAQGGIRLVQATVENHGPQGETLDGRGGQQQSGWQGGQQNGDSSQQRPSERHSGGQDRTGHGSETYAGRDSLDVVA